MKQSITLKSRQKELLRTLLNKQNPVSYKYLSEYFKLSTRTIQREIKSLRSTLKTFDIKIARKVGSGLEVQGSEESIEELRQQLEQAQIMFSFSPEERQEGIAYDLLLASEPIKQRFFSSKYGVSVVTISQDLDKVSSWLKENGEGITVDRSPGIGICIDSTEQQRRTLLSRLLHKDITFEDWLELFHEKNKEENLYGKLGSVIRNRLLKFVQTDKIIAVDRVLNEVMEEQSAFLLTDRNYVNLMIHIMLAMERIESGKVMEDTNLNKWEPFERDTLSVAKKIVERLQQVSLLTFPDIEVKYIALHLAGAKVSNKKDVLDDNNEEFIWIELTQTFIRSVEYYLEESFEGDQFLFEGLVSHFVPVFNRLKYNLQIHNPMLNKIKENYPDVFSACHKACVVLTEKIGSPIPDDEVGYLAMHIGASLIRIEEGMSRSFKAVVVCASGLGTSMYLATKIRSEISNIHVESVVSVNELSNWLVQGHHVDIIISTVNLPVVTDMNMVVVSPFLRKEDLAKIRNTLINTMHTTKQSLLTLQETTSEMEAESLHSIATFGEGMVQILRNFKVYEHVEVTSDLIRSVLMLLEDVPIITDVQQLTHDLKEREKQGGFVLDELAMLHTKSKGVRSLIVVVFRTKSPISWYGDDGKEHDIQTILLLVVPVDAPVEHMELISEIPAAFIDDTFMHVLITETEVRAKELIEGRLMKAFESRINSSLKGL